MIWLIGAGGMSVDYFNVLKSLEQEVQVIGRSESSCQKFQQDTQHAAISGGLDSFLNSSPVLPSAAIIAVGVEQLFQTSMRLLEYGVKRILVEKPGALSSSEIEQVEQCASKNNAKVSIAYNRRFYSSVLKAIELIKDDGGITSFNFELTEWSHVIEKLDKDPIVLKKWFLSNSTHVADLAFFLGGEPEQIISFTAGSLEWHVASSNFAGAGVSRNGALFNYGANWESAGRWSVEVLTRKNKYVLRPMEALQVQKRGTTLLEFVDLDDGLDKTFKPGLFLQVEAFLNDQFENLCSVSHQRSLFTIYEKMAGYK